MASGKSAFAEKTAASDFNEAAEGRTGHIPLARLRATVLLGYCDTAWEWHKCHNNRLLQSLTVSQQQKTFLNHLFHAKTDMIRSSSLSHHPRSPVHTATQKLKTMPHVSSAPIKVSICDICDLKLRTPQHSHPAFMWKVSSAKLNFISDSEREKDIGSH